MGVIIAAESAWPLARCNRPIFSGACPRTAIIHLENLEQYSRYENIWKTLDTNIDSSEIVYKDQISVVPFSSSTRERILTITQSFFNTATLSGAPSRETSELLPADEAH